MVCGFSLIEVMIAVLVLALGLLGLGAIFPVIVRQQRLATERTLAIAAADGAVAALRSDRRLNETPPGQPNRGWRALQQDTGGWSNNPAGMWEVPNASGSFITIDVNGLLRIGGTGQAGVDIPLSQRIYPGAYAGISQPRFVWDIAARRMPLEQSLGGNPQATSRDPIQVALFIRPIDPGINVPQRAREEDRHMLGATVRLEDVLLGTNEVSEGEVRVPVGVDSTTGEPTRNGTGEYGVPLVATALAFSGGELFGPGRDRVRFQSADDFRLIGQVGQKFVDRQGNIYEVRRVDNENENTVFVRPQVPPGIERISDFGPVVLTPQVPTAVRVFEVRP